MNNPYAQFVKQPQAQQNVNPYAQFVEQSEQEQPQQAPQQTPQQAPQQAQSSGVNWDVPTAANLAAAPEQPQMLMKEIGAAPELNELSVPAFKTSLGLLTQGDDVGAIGVIAQNIPDAKFRKDQEGNTIADLPSGSYYINKSGLSGQDIIKGAFDLAAFTPAGRAATIPAAVGTAAATDLGVQALGEQLGGEGVDVERVALAGGIGGAGKVAENVIGAGYRAFKGEAPEQATQVIEEATKLDIPVSTTDVLEPESAIGRFAAESLENIPLVGTAGFKAQQQQARQKAVDELIAPLQPRYDEVIEGLTNQTNKVKKAAGQRLNKVAQTMEAAGDIDVTTIIGRVNKSIDDLSSNSSVTDDAYISVLEKYKKALTEGQTFRTLDDLRTNFRVTVQGDKPNTPPAVMRSIGEIYGEMTKTQREAIIKELGEEAANKFSQAKGIYAREAEQIKNSRLKNLLEKGDITPEKARTVLFSRNMSDIKGLYSKLDSKGREAARATVLAELADKSRGLDGVISPNAFNKQMDRNKETIKTFFKGEDRKALEGLRKVLTATAGAEKQASSLGQAVPVAGIAAGAVADLLTTGASGLSVAALSKALNTRPVRSALLKLSNTPSKSTRFEKLLTELQTAITAATQAAAQQEQL